MAAELGKPALAFHIAQSECCYHNAPRNRLAGLCPLDCRHRL